MRDATKRASGLHAVHVLRIFGFFRKERTESTTGVKLEMPGPHVPTPPPMPAPEPMDPLRRDLRFKGLHADVNPSASVHPAEMTCPNCDRHFRYFTNGNGLATSVRCPSCARQYRV